MSVTSHLLLELAPEHDPRHIEAFLRLRFPDLDGIEGDVLHDGVQEAAHLIACTGPQLAESLASSYGI